MDNGLIWVDTTGYGMKEGVDLSPDYHESTNNAGEARVRTISFFIEKSTGIKNIYRIYFFVFLLLFKMLTKIDKIKTKKIKSSEPWSRLR